MHPVHSPNPALADAIAAALDWWREAGVDGDWSDAPQDWLAAARPAAPATPQRATAPAPEPVPLPGGGPENWPADLAGFAEWWMTEPLLAPPGLPRMAPEGPPGAALMIVLPMPPADAAGHALIDAFLAAAGLARSSVYLATAIPARIAAPDWDALREAGLGQILRHHVGLVRPARLLIFGQAGISALLGNDSPNSHWHLPSINHGDATIPALRVIDLDAIIARPALKARLWSLWLDWMPA